MSIFWLDPHTLSSCSPESVCQRTPECGKFVLFIYESWFNLSGSDGRLRVWRSTVEPYQACNIVQRDRFGGCSVMVWGGISIEGCTDLHVLNRGNLTGARYREEILRPITRPYAWAVSHGLLLVHDNARPHVAVVRQRILEDEGIDPIGWLARSWSPPDTSGATWINAFGGFQTHPGQSRSSPTPWLRSDRILILGQICSLIRSMSRRWRACIQSRGGHTCY